MNKKDYSVLVDCIETAKRDDDTEYKRIKEDTPKHIKDMVQNIMFENDNHSFDLDYDIMNSALMFLYDVDLKDIKESGDEVDERMYENEYASVYTQTRLGYMNIWNEDEITEKLKEYDCDIQTACAVWYDEAVRSVINQLIDKITS